VKTASLDMDYSTLMDRFRGRLVVPIFDATGKEVLGFGGRILESSNEKESDFKAAKYLNSPETLVFKKKNILFGQQMAKKAIRYWDKVEEAPRPVVIVEGYMDSIALWQAGICEAVACMGTALTSEQLLVAARIAGTKNGKIDEVATKKVCEQNIF
jgi:DNA primase